MKKAAIVALGAVLVLGAIGAATDDGSKKSSTAVTEKADQAQTTSAEVRYPEQMDTSDYIPIDADILYEYGEELEGRKVVTVIVVANTSRGQLSADTENNDSFYYSIQCSFDDKKIGEVFPEGSAVTVAGTVKGKAVIGSTIEIEECHAVGAGEIGEELKAGAESQLELCRQLRQEREQAEQEAIKQEKDHYIAECESVDHSAVARDPDNFKGKNIKVSGKVIQVSEGWFDSVTLRVDSGNNKVWYVTYTRKDGESRILEGDRLTCYGTCDGVESYTTVLGAQVTIPSMKMKYYD